jgi:hypothetical protein
LNIAVKRNNNLIMAHANLGVAFLVDPDGTKAAQALEQFRIGAKKKDKGLDNLNSAAFLINYAVAEQAAGQTAGAADKLRIAKQFLEQFKSAPMTDQLQIALRYNGAMLAAVSQARDGKDQAFLELERYLTAAGTDSLWWNLAYERYTKLGEQLKRKTASRQELTQVLRNRYLRKVVAVEVTPARLITLSESTSKALKLLGREQSIGVPIYNRATVKRYVEAAPGVDLVADDKVLAVFLTSAKAPPLVVQAEGVAGKKAELRVGMTMSEVAKVLEGQPFGRGTIDNPDVEYLFLPNLGVAIRPQGDRVMEIAVTQVARRTGF